MSDVSSATLGGQWPAALFMIVIVSWILYRFLAPASFKEWRNAGLIQAFVVALYAEMYGFPLTIYLLSRYLHLDIPWLHMRGHLWATLLGYGDTGAAVEMLLGYCLILVGLFLLVRGWRQIHRAQKEAQWVTSGLYGYMRHPQYAGIFQALVGQLIHWPTVPTLVLFPVIVLAYERLSKKEEAHMIRRYGNKYQNYMDAVPRFFPGKRQWRQIANTI
jgi:protein-S-isoprenylcysteine O-methyltransferase Ste14